MIRAVSRVSRPSGVKSPSPTSHEYLDTDLYAGESECPTTSKRSSGESEVVRMVEEDGVGWRVENGDVEGLAGLLERLRGDAGEVRRVGRRARRVFEERYERRVGVERVLRTIERCTR